MPLTAADIMNRPVTTVAPGTKLKVIADLLRERKISALPTCEAEGTLVGIVSEADVLKPLRESFRTRREHWLANLAAGECLSELFVNYLQDNAHTAADIMERDVVTADETATVQTMADLMLAHHVKRLPIMKGGRLVGIVSRHDLVAAIGSDAVAWA